MRLSMIAAAVAFSFASSTAIAAGSVGPSAGSQTGTWSELRDEIYGDREITKAPDGLLNLEVPYRAANDTRVPVSASVKFDDGRTIKSVTLIIDENPMPVSADFAMNSPQTAFSTSVAMRLNGPSNVRAIVETDDGELYMASSFVKTAGQGACAAPPTTGVEEALASLGQMDLKGFGMPKTAMERLKQADEPESKQVQLDLRHPQHSGMQMDQISLLYIPARYVETLEAWNDEEKLFTMTGSISLSEDPTVSFDVPDSGVQKIKVRMTDTEESMFEKIFELGGA